MSAFSAPARPAVDVAVLQRELETIFGLRCSVPTFVAGGQDTSASVLRAVTADGQEVAVKVTRGGRPSGLLVSDHLAGQGISAIPAPYRSLSGNPIGDCHAGRLSVTPWIRGRPGATGMTPEQWKEFGALLAQVHAARLPAHLASQLPREDYRTAAVADLRDIDQWLMRLTNGDEQADGAVEALCQALAQRWAAARPAIRLVAQQVKILSAELRQHPPADVLCHGDAHAFNVLLDQTGHVWLIDWDEVVLAPRERDLMFQIGGVLSEAQVNAHQQDCFFEGYGTVTPDARRLAYYRCSWSVQDLAAFAARVRDLNLSTPDREEAFGFLTASLGPHGIVTAALASVKSLTNATPGLPGDPAPLHGSQAQRKPDAQHESSPIGR